MILVFDVYVLKKSGRSGRNQNHQTALQSPWIIKLFNQEHNFHKTAVKN